MFDNAQRSMNVTDVWKSKHNLTFKIVMKIDYDPKQIQRSGYNKYRERII